MSSGVWNEKHDLSVELENLKNHETFVRQYLMMCPQPDRDVFELCCLWEYFTESFDRAICTCIRNGEYFPANEHESRLIQRNAHDVRRAIYVIAKRLKKNIRPQDKQQLINIRYEEIAAIAKKSRHFNEIGELLFKYTQIKIAEGIPKGNLDKLSNPQFLGD